MFVCNLCLRMSLWFCKLKEMYTAYGYVLILDVSFCCETNDKKYVIKACRRNLCKVNVSF